MRLYAGSSTHFVRDSTHNHIAAKLKSAFFSHYRCNPSPGEVQLWQDSLRACSRRRASTTTALLEYQLPLTLRRLDCIVTGHDAERSASAVILELKQWSDVDGASVGGDKVGSLSAAA